MVVTLFCFVAGCDQSFDPLGEKPGRYSIFGVLDTSADTQWVRVMPIRDSVYSGPHALDATVTLEERGSARAVVMKDSLILHPSGNPEEVAEFYAHAFWTTERLLPGSTYTLTVRGADGQSTSATVSMPNPVSSIIVSIRNDTTAIQDRVRVVGGGPLALMDVLHFEGRAPHFQAVNQVPRAGTSDPLVEVGRLTRPLDGGFDPPRKIRVCTRYRVCTIRLVLSGAPWPFDRAFGNNQSAYDDAISNVVNGTGFLGGITTVEVPYESCHLPRGTRSDLCDLTYHTGMAILDGVLLDSGCVGRTVAGALVSLRTLDGTRLRPDTLRADRSFRFGAIEPGVPHELVVNSPDFETAVVPFVLEPGERRSVQVILGRLRGTCGAP